MLWSTNTITTERFWDADTDAAAGTVAVAAMRFCFAPGITTSLVSAV
jgi:hypothetical protein